HTRSKRDWSSDVCSSDLDGERGGARRAAVLRYAGLDPLLPRRLPAGARPVEGERRRAAGKPRDPVPPRHGRTQDRRPRNGPEEFGGGGGISEELRRQTGGSRGSPTTAITRRGSVTPCGMRDLSITTATLNI